MRGVGNCGSARNFAAFTPFPQDAVVRCLRSARARAPHLEALAAPRPDFLVVAGQTPPVVRVIGAPPSGSGHRVTSRASRSQLQYPANRASKRDDSGPPRPT